MNLLQRVWRSNFNIILFVAVFFILNTVFYIYVGYVTPGGKTYSPVLEKYFNLPVWSANGLARLTTGLLRFVGFDTYQKIPKNISIVGGGGINITWGCLGIGVIISWLAFVLAHKASAKYKLRWIAFGIVVVCILNVIRLMLIPVAIHYHWHLITNLDVHTSFNIASYILIFIVAFFFTKSYRKYDQQVRLN